MYSRGMLPRVFFAALRGKTNCNVHMLCERGLQGLKDKKNSQILQS